MESFIHQQYLSDLSVCDLLIDSHKNSDHKGSPSSVGFINKNWKDSIDLNIYNIEPTILNNYLQQLQQVLNKYIEKFPASNHNAPWNRVEGQIQHYSPGKGFKIFHTERTGNKTNWHRHLVFMTYLNDVNDLGGTEFLHQQLTVQARKGLTLIWPVDWTHTHRGIISPSQEKYIITGWFSFY